MKRRISEIPKREIAKAFTDPLRAGSDDRDAALLNQVILEVVDVRDAARWHGVVVVIAGVPAEKRSLAS